MHYRGDGFGYDVIAPVGDFLRLMDNVVMLDDNVIEPEKLDAPVVAVRSARAVDSAADVVYNILYIKDRD